MHRTNGNVLFRSGMVRRSPSRTGRYLAFRLAAARLGELVVRTFRYHFVTSLPQNQGTIEDTLIACGFSATFAPTDDERNQGVFMPTARIVVVEDDSAIRRGVVDVLRVSGYEVAEASDGARGLEEAVRLGVDLVLLDLLLPRRDGLEVLTDLRKIRPTLPVIILTARGTEEDRVRGLKMGADDYVVKPFSARELLARVEAVLRRTLKAAAEVSVAHVGRGRIDLRRREVRWSDAERCDLSETESAILK